VSDQARLSAVLEVMINAALEAGEMILPLFHGGCASSTKSDGSIVTIADTKAEALIRAKLQEAFPTAGFLGEESVAEGDVPDLSGPYFCVDPIDGTKQFASGDPEWVISIGYLEAGRPVAGVIYAPALDRRLFAGLANFGGFEMSNSSERRAFEKPVGFKTTMRVLRGGHDSSDAVMRHIPAIDMTMRKVGSALKFGLIAAGDADVWVRAGRVWDWDIAAGQAIVEAAGGFVTDVDGNALIFGDGTAGYQHSPFLVRNAVLSDWFTDPDRY
jgi:3'(2'), 5'-bisphosphate nucleotidase